MFIVCLFPLKWGHVICGAVLLVISYRGLMVDIDVNSGMRHVHTVFKTIFAPSLMQHGLCKLLPGCNSQLLYVMASVVHSHRTTEHLIKVLLVPNTVNCTIDSHMTRNLV